MCTRVILIKVGQSSDFVTGVYHTTSQSQTWGLIALTFLSGLLRPVLSYNALSDFFGGKPVV